MPIDIEWSRRHRPFGIHHCGKDPHRFAASYAKLPHLDFLDLGWGGDVALLRRHLPQTFFNIRLDPVSIVRQTPAEIRETVIRLVRQSDNPWLTGVCCINMDQNVTDDQIAAIFDTVKRSAEGICGGGCELNRAFSMTAKFDYTKADAMAMTVSPMEPADFDIARYEAFAAEADVRYAEFLRKKEGVAVWQRVRVGEVFRDACREKETVPALAVGRTEPRDGLSDRCAVVSGAVVRHRHRGVRVRRGVRMAARPVAGGKTALPVRRRNAADWRRGRGRRAHPALHAGDD